MTSLGDPGAESVPPIVCPPQVAMIGIGRVVTRLWVADGAIGPRPVVTMTLAGDHRASDGHRGGLLLEADYPKLFTLQGAVTYSVRLTGETVFMVHGCFAHCEQNSTCCFS